MRKRIIILALSLLLVLSASSVAFCSLGGTDAEISIWEKELSGELSSQEAADMINSLPMENRSPDVQAAGSSSNETTSESITATIIPEKQKPEPKCSHTYTSEVLSEPTCTEKGIRKYTCQSCGNSYTEEIELIDEHDYREEITKEPTCDETGEKTFTCKDCGKTYTELLNILGHNDEMERTKNPTCTEDGEDTYTCKRCGMMHTESVKATGHTEGEWNTVMPNSMFTEGLREKRCTDCGVALAEETIPSTYPIHYLYVGIGAVIAMAVAVIIVIIGIIKYKKKK